MRPSRRAAGEARALLEGLSLSFAVLLTLRPFPGSTEALVAAVAEETGPLPLIACGALAVVRGARARSSPGPPVRSGSLLG